VAASPGDAGYLLHHHWQLRAHEQRNVKDGVLQQGCE